MAITRITARWSGFQGAPGYTSFHFAAFGAGDLIDEEFQRVRSFFLPLANNLPDGVRISILGEAEVIDEATGTLQGYAQNSDGDAGINGIGSGAYSAPSGGLISWTTDTVARGRRLRGRTFIVPMTNSSYDADGTLSSAARDALEEAAEALLGDGTGQPAVIWSRPSGGAGGTIGNITGYRVPDMATVLRSRRD